MKLYCPICRKSYNLEEGLLRCPESTEAASHPFVLKFEDGDFPQNLIEEIRNRYNSGELSFNAFKELLGSWHLANVHNKSDEWQKMVKTASKMCEKNTSKGFVRTPLFKADELAKSIKADCNIFAKNETLQLMGSHKSRHLAGSIIYLETLRMLKGGHKKPLAIFSCGNAALGASAAAKAFDYPLYTFVPEHVDSKIENLLTNLDAKVVKVSREGQVGEGDPCNIRFREALNKLNFVPFSCYGYDIWSSIEGAEPLAYEFFFDMEKYQTDIDAFIVQIGGGGLAKSMINGIQNLLKLGIIKKLPRFYTVQTASCYPLAKSYFAILKEASLKGAVTLAENLKSAVETDIDPKDILEKYPQELNSFAKELSSNFSSNQALQKVLLDVAAQRSNFFKAWADNVPESIAEGILDDTTYDGLEVVIGMLESGGLPLIADEKTLDKANKLTKKATNINVSATGTASVAAVIEMATKGLINSNENIGLLLTGIGSRETSRKTKEHNVITLGRSENINKILD
ncbi:MAG: pyridoxal-phosphate dependent enzyme [Alphaproteobacteria bacterium]